jgi:hypothetical protein
MTDYRVTNPRLRRHHPPVNYLLLSTEVGFLARTQKIPATGRDFHPAPHQYLPKHSMHRNFGLPDRCLS